MYSIGIITAEQTLHSIMQADREMRDHCNVTYLPYSSLEHLCFLYQENAERFDALLFSGSYPCHVVLERFGSIARPYAYFTFSERDYYCLIAQLAVQEPGLDFSRVFIDTPEIPVDFRVIFERDGVPLQDAEAVPACPYSSQYPLTLDYYRRLWQSGAVDLIITRFKSMETTLREEGIRCRGILPSPESMLETFQGLELRLTAAMVQDAATCVGIVTPRRAGADMEELERQLELCNRQLGNIFLLYRHGERLELTSNVSSLRELTGQYTVCPVSAWLRSHYGEAVAVGWGWADNVVDAHRNARRGLTEALRPDGHPACLVTPDGCVLGLTAEDAAMGGGGGGETDFVRLSRESGLAEGQLRSLSALLERQGGETVTAEALAGELGSSTRTALRILTRLEDCGLASARYGRTLNRRGRPAKLYRVTLGRL